MLWFEYEKAIVTSTLAQLNQVDESHESGGCIYSLATRIKANGCSSVETTSSGDSTEGQRLWLRGGTVQYA